MSLQLLSFPSYLTLFNVESNYSVLNFPCALVTAEVMPYGSERLEFRSHDWQHGDDTDIAGMHSCPISAAPSLQGLVTVFKCGRYEKCKNRNSFSPFFYFFVVPIQWLCFCLLEICSHFLKLNNFFFFYLFQTNPLTSLRPSLLMVSPLWFLSAHLRWSFDFWALRPNNDHRQPICAFEVGDRMCALPYLAALLSVSTLLVWQAHGQVCSGPLMYEGSFDDLIWSAPHS